MSNQTGVTETLMAIDYDMKLYPRLTKAVFCSWIVKVGFVRRL
jgi:hypothetical protein